MASKAFTLDWKGDELLADVLDAAKGGVDAVLERSAEQARANAPRRTGDLANGFVRAPAIRKGNEVIGVWGNTQWYFWIVEARHPSQAGFARRAADTGLPDADRRNQAEVAEVSGCKHLWVHTSSVKIKCDDCGLEMLCLKPNCRISSIASKRGY